MDDLIRMSCWSHCFERHEMAAFFHSVSLGLAFIPEEAGRSLVQILKEPKTRHEVENAVGPDVVNFLLQEGILVQGDDASDQACLGELRQKLLGDITVELLYLLVTDHCNLCCRYCFEEAPVCIEPFRPTHMTVETAERAIDLFARMTNRYGNLDKKKVVHLYGGEPLVNQKVVRFAVEHVRALKDQNILPSTCEAAIVTNGTFLDDSLAKFFAENGVTVGISVDGPREINNLYRQSKDGRLDIFGSTMRALEHLRKHHAKVGLSVTLTPEVVRHFDRVLDFLVDQMGWVDGVSLNILHFNPSMSLSPDYYVEATKCQIAAFERFRQIGMYEDRVMRKAKAFVTRQPLYADCGVVGSQLVVAPDGQIGVCQDFVKPRTYFHGSVMDQNIDPVADGLFEQWRKRSPLFMESCVDCPALGICGGGCPASAELKTGNRWNLDERACAHSKLILEWMIWDTYAQIS